MSDVANYEWEPATADIALRAGIDPTRVLRFDTNTSPFEPPWLPAAAADAANALNEYPDSGYAVLCRALADYHGVDPDQVTVGAGADEMIRLCAQAFLSPGATAATDDPAYPLYGIVAAQREAATVKVAREHPALGFPADALAAAARRAPVTWLCVPHNPTGDRPPQAEVATVLDAAVGIAVVDAAYAEFCGDRWGDEVRSRSNLVVLGTLSKAFGLAGIRVGYALARPGLIRMLDAVRPPGSISTLSAALAYRALTDLDWMRANVAAVVAERETLTARLAALGLGPYPSSANFILCRVGGRAGEVASRLLAEGIVPRTFPAGGTIADHLRFTVRTAADHDRLIDTLQRSI
jgi:histidinol-phosphate aminotransferase